MSVRSEGASTGEGINKNWRWYPQAADACEEPLVTDLMQDRLS